MKNIYLFQPQYSVDYRQERNYWLPYSVGCLWSYCNQFTLIQENFKLGELFFKREHHDSVLERIDNPAVCGFSCYQWNKNYNVLLAEKIKQRWPNCVIVFGGPDTTTNFLDYNFVDVVVLGEGEYAFYDILEKIVKKESYPEIYNKQRVNDLNLPSPYTTGVFDQIIADNPDVKWAATLETNRGCPFACTFCDWGSVTYSKVKKFDLGRVQQEIQWMAEHPVSYIMGADANFGIFKERDLQIAQMIAHAAKVSKSLEIFFIAYNKNSSEWLFKILNELGDLNRGFTLSVQSLNPNTLKAIKRDNMQINDLKKMFELCDQYNIDSYTEVILGLPLETKESFIQGMCNLLELGQHSQIDVWLANVLPNSELASPLDRITYKLKTIKTQNYLGTMNHDIDYYPEEIEIINGTSTMSTDEIIECYIYAWLIVNFHLQGYTQVYSKYCRHVFNITYKEFYDCFLNEIVSNKVLSPIYQKLHSTVSKLFKFGETEYGQRGHNLMFMSGLELYQNKQTIFSVANRVVEKLTKNSDHDIERIQQSLIFDYQHNYPFPLTCSFDLNSFEFTPTTYNINTRFVDHKKTSSEDFNDLYYTMRKKGFLKNQYTKC